MTGAKTRSSSQALLEIQDLRTHFEADGGRVPAVDGVSLTIHQGRTAALVGESGCGKSVTALSILRLIPQPPGRIVGGRIMFNDRIRDAPPHADDVIRAASGSERINSSVAAPPTIGHATSRQTCADPIDLLQIGDQAMRRIRGNRIAMIFQEPMTALNPVYSIGEQIVEAVELHQGLRDKDAWAAAAEALRRVGIPDAVRRSRDYPHQLSGGMRQRVMIAMALSCTPALLIADEPTTALDVTVQQQILELLRAIQAETDMSMLLITHDFSVVAEAADDVYVMYAGRIVEHGPVADVLSRPLHPYTQGLLRCMPRLSQRKKRLEVISGNVPDPRGLPSGCRFHPRCRLSADRASVGDRETAPVKSEIFDVVLRCCVEEYDAESSGTPTLREVGSNHFVACWEADPTAKHWT
jgi:oligopeptide/dipeptide ABC transporter ATP-binding protein